MAQPATRRDWKALPLPEKRAGVPIGRAFPPDEMARIRMGVVPEAMEDRWLVFFEEGRLHFHRSWTGVCVYVVRFEERPGGAEVVSAEVNRDPSRCGGADAARDRALILYLIDALLLGRPGAYPALPRDPDRAALEQGSTAGRGRIGGGD